MVPSLSRTWTTRRLVGVVLLASACVAWPFTAQGSCAGTDETGLWRNDDASSDLARIEIRMLCERDRLQLQASVWRSDQSLFARPFVPAHYVRTTQGERWLFAKVPTGGYLDKIWVRAVTTDGQRYLRVVIRHESLDSKPSSHSKFWFRKA